MSIFLLYYSYKGYSTGNLLIFRVIIAEKEITSSNWLSGRGFQYLNTRQHYNYIKQSSSKSTPIRHSDHKSPFCTIRSSVFCTISHVDFGISLCYINIRKGDTNVQGITPWGSRFKANANIIRAIWQDAFDVDRDYSELVFLLFMSV